MQNEKDTIQKICRDVRRMILKEEGTSTDQCGYASEEIQARLNELGIQVSIRDGRFLIDYKRYNKFHQMPHTWIEWNGMPIDITADQFNPYLKCKNRVKAIVFGTHKHRFLTSEGENFY